MGILLIALGVIMLVSQILKISMLEHIVKWWPVVLIMIGIEILVYIALSKQEEPKVKFDIFSIIIISMLMMVGVGMYAVTSLVSFADGNISLGPVFEKYKYELKFTKNFSVDAQGSKLVVDNGAGDVEVVKGEGEKVEIEANISIKNNDEEYASKIANSLIDVKSEGNVKVSSKARQYSNKGAIGSISIDYIIKVPDTLNVEVDNEFGDVVLRDIALSGKVDNQNGDVTITSLGGDLVVNSSFGKIDVKDIKGKAELHLQNGDIIANSVEKGLNVENSFGNIEINDIKEFTSISNQNGETQGEGITGNLTVVSKFGNVIFSDVSGSVDINQENGDVEISDVGENVKVFNNFGDIKIVNANKGINLNGSNGKITLETAKVIEKDVSIENKFGDINLILPGTQNGYFEANSNLGSIKNEFGFNVKEEVTKQSMKGTLIDDKVKFKVSNDNGDINFEKFK